MKSCAKSTFISDFEATMATIPYDSGYSPLQWQNRIDVMLEKKGKELKAKKLRTICLMEADFNHNNKKLGRDIMNCAERNKLLPR